MATIVPTLTASTLTDYDEQLKKVTFAPRLHIDFADGILAPTRLLNMSKSHWPDETEVDFHIMYEHPAAHVSPAVRRSPRLIILHAEAKDALQPLLVQIKEAGIMAGLAFLVPTAVNDFRAEVTVADHALVFGGHLGYQGGEADLQALEKIPELKAINPNLEIGWDGGVNQYNISSLLDAGVEVVNVGSYLQSAAKPKSAYAILQQIANSS